MTHPLHIWQCGSFCFERMQPLVMGILNVTPDSFSDGGKYSERFDALVHANNMLEEGADIIEVGGESTRPGSVELASEQELERVLPVVKALAREGVCVAVDTRHAEVARVCVDEGAAIINDITGFSDPAMQELAAQSSVGCVVMHMQGMPQTMQENPQYDDVVSEISDYLLTQAQELRALGVSTRRICLDPGPGFGKNSDQNLALLKATDKLANLGEPPYILMAAWSRKRFIGELTHETTPSERVAGSVAVACYAASRGAGVLRVHDVKATVDALKILDAVYG